MISFAGSLVSWICRSPFDLPAHRLKVPLHADHGNGDRAHQAEMVRVLGEHRCVVSVNRQRQIS